MDLPVLKWIYRHYFLHEVINISPYKFNHEGGKGQKWLFRSRKDRWMIADLNSPCCDLGGTFGFVRSKELGYVYSNSKLAKTDFFLTSNFSSNFF